MELAPSRRPSSLRPRYFEDLQEPTGDAGEFIEVGLELTFEKAELIAVQLGLPSADYVLRMAGDLAREGPFERYLLPTRVDTHRGVVDYEGPRQMLVMCPYSELHERLQARGLI